MKLLCTQVQNPLDTVLDDIMAAGGKVKGTLMLNIGPQRVGLIGAPFQDYDHMGLVRRDYLHTVRMAKEIPYKADTVCGVPDFSVPTLASARHMVREVMQALEEGKVPVLGCMAGQGRTGLGLSLIVKALFPTMTGWEVVQFVRGTYYPHAVETTEQLNFVSAFTMNEDDLKKMLQFKRNMHLRYWMPWLPIAHVKW